MPYASACGNPQEWWVPASRLYAAGFSPFSEFGRKLDIENSPYMTFYVHCGFISMDINKKFGPIFTNTLSARTPPWGPELLHYAICSPD
jgi:hypothetical protein